jgi:hypothetical protein
LRVCSRDVFAQRRLNGLHQAIIKNRSPFKSVAQLLKSVAQLRALAGAWRERADNATSTSLAEQMLRTAREFDEKAAEMENSGIG